MVAKKRERERSRRPLHLKRVYAQIKVETQAEPAKVLDARILLNDITPQGLGLFSMEPILVGQNIAITLDHPSRIYLKGRVVHCQEFAVNSHIMSKDPFLYRVGIHFQFVSKEEEDAVAKFCEGLSSDQIHNKIPA